jgi:hypothetical protein
MCILEGSEEFILFIIIKEYVCGAFCAEIYIYIYIYICNTVILQCGV